MSGPLESIRVLDLGTRIGAPFAATLLADLGAEVIKMELPGQGDFMRTIGPFLDGYSLFWAVEGRNKKSVTCDLRKPAGQALFKANHRYLGFNVRANDPIPPSTIRSSCATGGSEASPLTCAGPPPAT